jgi:hypothetical protein
LHSALGYQQVLASVNVFLALFRCSSLGSGLAGRRNPANKLPKLGIEC